MRYIIARHSSNSTHFQSNAPHCSFITVLENEQFADKITPSAKNYKILVVEDNRLNQIVAKELLESKGYQVTIAANGQEALMLYQSNHYAAILMDVGLPDMPGTEVTRQIRLLEQATAKKTPIIACTANDSSIKGECLQAGMDDFSVKPFDINLINPLLKTWIEKLN